MLVIIFIVDVNEFISMRNYAPQEPEDKIISTYKKETKTSLDTLCCGPVSAIHYDL